MMKNRWQLLLCLLAVLFSNNIKGARVIGSDISWEKIAKDSFLVRYVVYATCAGTDLNYANFSLECNKTGKSIKSVYFAPPTPFDVTPVCDTMCSPCTQSGCTFTYGIEKYVYTKLIYVGNTNCCELKLSHGDFFRPNYFTTIISTGRFYTEAVFNKCLDGENSSPKFKNMPVSIICNGQDFLYSNGTKNSDTSGSILLDSIAYSLVYPLGADSSNVAFNGKYDYNKPVYFWGFPNPKLPFPRGFHLDDVSGTIGFRPMKTENTIMTVKVAEFRYDSVKGTKVQTGYVKREMALFIIDCKNNRAPVLSGPYFKEVCVGDTIEFTVNTLDIDANDSLTISWSQNIEGAVWTDNNDTARQPTGILKWVPSQKHVSNIPYQFTATVHDNACPIHSSSTRIYQILVKGIPEASISKIDSGCGNYYFNATNLGGSSTATYFWESPVLKDFVSNARINNYTLDAPGKYPYQLSVTDKKCVTTYFDTIVISDTFIQLNQIQNPAFCPNEPINLKIDYSYYNTTPKFKWSTGETSQSKSLQVKDSFLITYSVEDSNGCKREKSTILKAMPAPEIKLYSFKQRCIGGLNSNAIYLNNYVGVDSSNIKLEWNNWKNPKSIFKGFFMPPLAGVGHHMLTIKATDTVNGCSSYDSSIMIVNPLPAVNAGQDIEACVSHQKIELKGVPSKSYWQWQTIGTFNGLVTDSLKWFFDTKAQGISEGNTYQFVFSHVDLNGCENKDTMSISIIQNDLTVLIDKSIKKSCYPHPFEAKATYANAERFKWEVVPGKAFGDFVTPNDTHSKYQLNQQDLVNLSFSILAKAYNDKNNCSATDSITVLISGFPKVNFIVASKGNLKVNFLDSSVIETGVISNYFWEFGDGDTSSKQNPSHTYAKAGTYTVKLVVTSHAGCSHFITKEIEIDQNGVGVDENSNIKILVYPVPMQDKLLIKSNQIIEQVQIFNSLGALVQNQISVKHYDVELDIKKLPKGGYILKVQCTNNTIYQEVIIK